MRIQDYMLHFTCKLVCVSLSPTQKIVPVDCIAVEGHSTAEFSVFSDLMHLVRLIGQLPGTSRGEVDVSEQGKHFFQDRILFV